MILTQSLYDYCAALMTTPGAKAAVIVLILGAVEISPVKINPWSWVGGLIGKLLGIKAISEKLDALDKKVDENQATTIRVRILQFEDSLQSGKEHSKDSWNQVMDDISRYEQYTNSHPNFKNNITEASVKHINKVYSKLLEKHAWTTTLKGDE